MTIRGGRLAFVVALAAGPVAAASSSLPETPARELLKSVPREVLNAPKPKRFSLEERKTLEAAAQRADADDTIVVVRERDPEDVVRARKPPLLALRETLERDRRMTPAQMAKGVLCLIGLCPVYGPDGAPPEPSQDARQAALMNRSVSDLGRQFHGTLQ